MAESTDSTDCTDGTDGTDGPDDADGTDVGQALAALTTSSEAGDHAATGFHHIHVVAPAMLPELAQVFRDHDYWLEMITCQDRREDLSKMRLVYTFNRFESSERHRVHADLDPDQQAPSLVAISRAADWMEREVYDMYGVVFADHPDLKRILLPDDSDFHALLKDFGRMEDAEEADDGAGAS